MPSAKPRLFISHSSKDQTLTADVVAALGSAVDQHPGFELLVDTECLKAGEEWPQQLHAMMAYAHGGLLLFTPAAMQRPDWIRKEAYILTWRRSLDRSFKVFYVFLDGVTQKDLTDRGFAPAHLDLLQRLAASTPAAIADEVRALSPAVSPRTPFEQLTHALAQHLAVDTVALDHLADSMGSPLVPWLPGNVKMGIGRIAASLLGGKFGAVQNLSGLVNSLKSLGVEGDALKKVMRWVAPYWVAPDAAGRLAAVTHDLWQKQVGGWALINGRSVAQYTAKMFVYKVLPFAFESRVAMVETGTRDPSADYYTAQICAWLRKQDESLPPDERVGYPSDDQALLEQLEVDDPFLFVPLATPDRETLATLRERFPRVVFLLWTGQTLEPLGFDLPEAVELVPPVDEAVEEVQYAQWRTALKALKG